LLYSISGRDPSKVYVEICISILGNIKPEKKNQKTKAYIAHNSFPLTVDQKYDSKNHKKNKKPMSLHETVKDNYIVTPDDDTRQ